MQTGFFWFALLLVGGGAALLSAWLLAGRARALGELAGVSGVFAGGVAGAAAVSLPEISAVLAGVNFVVPDPGVSVGVVLGALLFDLLVLGVFGLAASAGSWRAVATRGHAGLAVLGAVLVSVLVLSGLAGGSAGIWGVGLGSLGLVLVYAGGLWALVASGWGAGAGASVDVRSGTRARSSVPGAGGAVLKWLVVWGLVLVLVVGSYAAAYGASGAGGAFGPVGLWLVLAALLTVPEALVVWASVRAGEPGYGLAVLLGCCSLDVVSFGLADGVYRGGLLAGALSGEHLVAGVVGAVLLAAVGCLLVSGARLGPGFVRVVMGLVALGALGGVGALAAS